VTVMNLPALIAALRRDEGVRLKPYADTTGHLTIGVGHNLTDKGISLAVAEAILDEDVDEVLLALLNLPWFVALSDVRQQAVANMAFNLGVSGLLQFTRMVAALERGDYIAAASEMLASLWARQVGARADRLAVMMVTDDE
jgi:lysozyme